MRKEEFTDITEICRHRGERIRPNARVIVASGGGYNDNRRYWGYSAGWNTLKLYPADRYTASITARPFCICHDLIEISKPAPPPAVDSAEAARKAAAAAAKEKREQKRAAEERARAEQFSIFEGGTANVGA